jgi:hypothetical protein
MSVYDYRSLAYHVGHEIVCVSYGDGVNVAVECETCNEVLIDYNRPNSTRFTTPELKCEDCGHVSDRFIQPAKVHCDALVDYKGEFQWWFNENFENPDFEEGTFLCEKCYSDNLLETEEEE